MALTKKYWPNHKEYPANHKHSGSTRNFFRQNRLWGTTHLGQPQTLQCHHTTKSFRPNRNHKNFEANYKHYSVNYKVSHATTKNFKLIISIWGQLQTFSGNHTDFESKNKYFRINLSLTKAKPQILWGPRQTFRCQSYLFLPSYQQVEANHKHVCFLPNHKHWVNYRLYWDKLRNQTTPAWWQTQT